MGELKGEALALEGGGFEDFDPCTHKWLAMPSSRYRMGLKNDVGGCGDEDDDEEERGEEGEPCWYCVGHL